MNCRGILASCPGRTCTGVFCTGGFETCTGGFETRPYQRRPPGWPVLEALAITAAALLVVTLAVELGAALAACLPF
jgi:hypothetical protein